MSLWFRLQCDDEECLAALESMRLDPIDDHMAESGWVTVDGFDDDLHYCPDHLPKETAG